MGLNPEQAAHIRDLQNNPDKVCGCGWFFKDECGYTCPNPQLSGPLETAHRNGYKEGRERERHRAVLLTEGVRKDWGNAYPESVGTRSGKMALSAAIHRIKDKSYV